MTKKFKVAISSPSIIKDGGTSSQYLMADGSISSGPSSGIKYTYSSTAPSTPTSGDIWVDTSDGTEYTYISDGDSTQWVELGFSGVSTSITDANSGQIVLALQIFG